MRATHRQRKRGAAGPIQEMANGGRQSRLPGAAGRAAGRANVGLLAARTGIDPRKLSPLLGKLKAAVARSTNCAAGGIMDGPKPVTLS